MQFYLRYLNIYILYIRKTVFKYHFLKKICNEKNTKKTEKIAICIKKEMKNVLFLKPGSKLLKKSYLTLFAICFFIRTFAKNSF